MRRYLSLVLVVLFLALPASAVTLDRDASPMDAIGALFERLIDIVDIFDKAGPMCDPFGKPAGCDQDDGNGLRVASPTDPAPEPIDEQ